MITVIQWIGYLLVILLCVFSLCILFYCFRGGLPNVEQADESKPWARQVLDKAAWGINGIALLGIVLTGRHRLFRLVELSEAMYNIHDSVPARFEDTGRVVTIEEGMVLELYITNEEKPTSLWVRRPFSFLARNWRESMDALRG